MGQSRREVARGRRRGVSARPGFESLEGRQLLTVSITPIADVNVPATKTLFVPVHGTDSAGNAINYTVASSNQGVTATVRSGHPYLKLSVANFGDMTFQLFDDLAPNTVAKITTLVNQGFYNGLTFHRIVPNFVDQGGDPAGNGSGGPGFTFADEFNANAIFDGSGQLAMANSGPNTNGSQFFITIGPQRFLDFNYNLYGQIVSGQSVAAAINAVPTDANGKPTTAVTITSATIVTDTSDTVLMIKAPAGTGTSAITVTGTDAVDHTTTTATFNATFAPDTTDDPSFLATIPDQTTTAGTPVNITLASTDLEGDPVTYGASNLDSPAKATVTVNGNVVTITPNAGVTGPIKVQATVAQTGATSRGSTADPRDIRTFTVNVNPATTTTTITPTGTAVSATAEQSLTTTYASFTASPVGTAAGYSATVTFGDGTTGPGTIVANTTGGYQVLATHTYATSGVFNTSVAIKGPDNSTATATSSATVNAPAAAALSILITATPNPGIVGQSLTYTVKVTNTGTESASGVTLQGILSGGLTYVSSSITPTSTTGGMPTIPLGDLAVGQSRSVDIVVNPTTAGTVSLKAVATTAAGVTSQNTQPTTVNDAPTGTGGGTTTPPGSFGGGNLDRSITYVRAPRGVSQHAINLTSRTFSRVLEGLRIVMARFGSSGNVARLEADLGRLSRHIPYGHRDLLPVWTQTITSMNPSTTPHTAHPQLRLALRDDLTTYLADNIGGDLNVIRSHERNGSDRLLTFNGLVD